MDQLSAWVAQSRSRLGTRPGRRT